MSQKSPANPSEHRPHYLTRNEGFGLAVPEDDLLHPEANAAISDVSLTETQYFGFCVPEEQILGLGFQLHRQNLGVVTAGVWAWQGFKPHTLASELFDIRAFMSDDVLRNDLHQIRFDNGYGVQVLDPMKKQRLTYSDPVRKNSLELEYNAVADAVMFGNGVHFEQLMQVSGELVLRGKRYDVQCFNIRDRSWGKPRQEGNQPLPPIAWKTGVFNEGFAFNSTAFDNADLMPEWGGRFALPDDQVFNSGWVLKDGEVVSVIGSRKRTERDPKTLYPKKIEMELTDAKQRIYKIKGTVIAANHWDFYPTIRFVNSSILWECDGQAGYGEVQEGHFNDFMHAFMR